MNRPSVPVIFSVNTPAGDLTVTLAFGTLAPVWSFTAPVTAPDWFDVCAQADVEISKNKNGSSGKRWVGNVIISGWICPLAARGVFPRAR